MLVLDVQPTSASRRVGVDPLPWNPGAAKYGIQTMYGVKKPAYRGMQFISDWRAGMAVPVKAGTGGQNV